MTTTTTANAIIERIREAATVQYSTVEGHFGTRRLFVFGDRDGCFALLGQRYSHGESDLRHMVAYSVPSGATPSALIEGERARINQRMESSPSGCIPLQQIADCCIIADGHQYEVIARDLCLDGVLPNA